MHPTVSRSGSQQRRGGLPMRRIGKLPREAEPAWRLGREQSRHRTESAMMYRYPWFGLSREIGARSCDTKARGIEGPIRVEYARGNGEAGRQQDVAQQCDDSEPRHYRSTATAKVPVATEVFERQISHPANQRAFRPDRFYARLFPRARSFYRAPAPTCRAGPTGTPTSAAQAGGKSAKRNGLRGGDGGGCSASSVNHHSSSLPQPSPGGGGA